MESAESYEYIDDLSTESVIIPDDSSEKSSFQEETSTNPEASVSHSTETSHNVTKIYPSGKFTISASTNILCTYTCIFTAFMVFVSILWH